MSKEITKPSTAEDNNLVPGIMFRGTKMSKTWWKLFKIRKKLLTIKVNLYIAYELNVWSYDLDTDFTLKNSLFGDGKLTENTDPHNYSHSGYGIAFDTSLAFSLSRGDGFGKNVIIFGLGNSSSVYGDNRKNVQQMD